MFVPGTDLGEVVLAQVAVAQPGVVVVPQILVLLVAVQVAAGIADCSIAPVTAAARRRIPPADVVADPSKIH